MDFLGQAQQLIAAAQFLYETICVYRDVGSLAQDLRADLLALAEQLQSRPIQDPAKIPALQRHLTAFLGAATQVTEAIKQERATWAGRLRHLVLGRSLKEKLQSLRARLRDLLELYNTGLAGQLADSAERSQECLQEIKQHLQRMSNPDVRSKILAIRDPDAREFWFANWRDRMEVSIAELYCDVWREVEESGLLTSAGSNWAEKRHHVAKLCFEGIDIDEDKKVTISEYDAFFFLKKCGPRTLFRCRWVTIVTCESGHQLSSTTSEYRSLRCAGCAGELQEHAGSVCKPCSWAICARCLEQATRAGEETSKRLLREARTAVFSDRASAAVAGAAAPPQDEADVEAPEERTGLRCHNHHKLTHGTVDQARNRKTCGKCRRAIRAGWTCRCASPSFWVCNGCYASAMELYASQQQQHQHRSPAAAPLLRSESAPSSFRPLCPNAHLMQQMGQLCVPPKRCAVCRQDAKRPFTCGQCRVYICKACVQRASRAESPTPSAPRTGSQLQPQQHQARQVDSSPLRGISPANGGGHYNPSRLSAHDFEDHPLAVPAAQPDKLRLRCLSRHVLAPADQPHKVSCSSCKSPCDGHLLACRPCSFYVCNPCHAVAEQAWQRAHPNSLELDP